MSAAVGLAWYACAEIPRTQLVFLADRRFVGRAWMPVPLATTYYISDAGELVSFRGSKPRQILGGTAGQGGYRAAALRHDDGTRRGRYFHRMVLEAFRGPAPDDAQTRHLDGNPLNNSLRNLAWGTPTENHADQVRHGTAPVGERNPQARLTRAAVEQMRAERARTGTTYSALAEKYGVSTMTALRAVKREAWR